MTARRNALGRGLGALISPPSATPTRSSDSTAVRSTHTGVDTHESEPLEIGSPAHELPVHLIDPNPEQPRRHFDPDQLERLAASILQHGILQPVVVRRSGERFELIVGERRWRASRAAGLANIPAVVADVAPQERLELAIVENVQRHDLNPIELAHAYKALAASGATQEEIGRKVAMDRSSIANHLRLLDLSTDLQQDVEEGRISMGHAKALLQVHEEQGRRALRDRIVGEGLSVRATEQLGRKLAGPVPGRIQTTAPTRAGAPLDPDLQRIVDALQERFQTRVNLRGGGRKGRLEFDYAGGEELERLFDLMLDNA
ncbi:MAG: ParB/RepB/Spo0J family partition protein [Deltaproteobacteria bacterium]|nr:ParB/RepB/Spo0J family partition protein [Deltaproteobacteria bacterium]MBW2384985.1 ParB/RepB/Spo0J family partition protein [Deltaproteobacteria bacterium]MBW2695499.1 ParB/RepB/Spo0J family partition protein [Deltaproteobacteria bacterium]